MVQRWTPGQPAWQKARGTTRAAHGEACHEMSCGRWCYVGLDDDLAAFEVWIEATAIEDMMLAAVLALQGKRIYQYDLWAGRGEINPWREGPAYVEHTCAYVVPSAPPRARMVTPQEPPF
jgi:hypothetical protein